MVAVLSCPGTDLEQIICGVILRPVLFEKMDNSIQAVTNEI